MNRMKGDGALDNRMASYDGDAMVATAGLLSAMNLLAAIQGYWTEHSERSVIPTKLSVLEVPPSDKDILGRWKLEGSDTFARSYGGRVARLQATFDKAARGKVDLQRATHLSEELATTWRRPRVVEEPREVPLVEETATMALDEPEEEAYSSDE